MPTIIVIADPAAPDATEAVKSEGAPVAEVVDCGEYYLALDAGLELIAAHALGLAPRLIVHPRDAAVYPAAYPWFDAEDWERRVAAWPENAERAEDDPAPPRLSYTAGEVADEINKSGHALNLEFPEVEILD